VILDNIEWIGDKYRSDGLDINIHQEKHKSFVADKGKLL